MPWYGPVNFWEITDPFGLDPPEDESPEPLPRSDWIRLPTGESIAEACDRIQRIVDEHRQKRDAQWTDGRRR